jgi:hypothetical protein
MKIFLSLHYSRPLSRGSKYFYAEVQRKHYLPFFAPLKTVTFGSSLEKTATHCPRRSPLLQKP